MVTEEERHADMSELMAMPSFRRFLFRSVQLAGLLDYPKPATDGSGGRDLAFVEGRRSLGFDLLRDADAGQPASLRHPQSVFTLIAALREEANPAPKEKKRDRYEDVQADPE